jgi:hypothetical protein
MSNASFNRETEGNSNLERPQLDHLLAAPEA